MEAQISIRTQISVPEATVESIAEPNSPTAALLTYQRIACVLVLFMLLCCSTGQSYGADTLECPEIGSSSVPDLIGDASGGGLFATESRVDLANVINEAINRLQTASPNISWTDVQNVLVAGYCRSWPARGDLPRPTNGAACARSIMSWNGRSQRT